MLVLRNCYVEVSQAEILYGRTGQRSHFQTPFSVDVIPFMMMAQNVANDFKDSGSPAARGAAGLLMIVAYPQCLIGQARSETGLLKTPESVAPIPPPDHPHINSSFNSPPC